MEQPIPFNYSLLIQLFRFNASLGAYRFFKGIDYGRVMELPVFADKILQSRTQALSYLDIGSGDSILPSFVAMNSEFHVIVIDKFHWVQRQKRYLEKLGKLDMLVNGRFTILEKEFLQADLQDGSFDIISALSVVEHIEGEGDTEAVIKTYRLLKPGGIFILSVPYNHDKAIDYFLKHSVYGENPKGGKVFFQRHYNAETLRIRIFDRTPLVIERLFYASHYKKFNFAKRFYVLPMPFKLLKIFYNWATPFYVPRLMKLSSQPPSDPRPAATTVDTVFVTFRKPV